MRLWEQSLLFVFVRGALVAAGDCRVLM